MKTDKTADQTKVGDDTVSRISKNKMSHAADNSDFPIVGIGASAGGLEAIKEKTV